MYVFQVVVFVVKILIIQVPVSILKVLIHQQAYGHKIKDPSHPVLPTVALKTVNHSSWLRTFFPLLAFTTKSLAVNNSFLSLYKLNTLAELLHSGNTEVNSRSLSLSRGLISFFSLRAFFVNWLLVVMLVMQVVMITLST